MARNPDETRFQQQRDRVLKAAAHCFNRKGYSGTSLKDVASILGLTDPALYYYVRNKEELVYLCYVRATELGKEARHYNFNAYSDARAIFRYDMHALPTEISASIGTSTLFAAWNAAVYVAQIEDERLAGALSERSYLDATDEVLRENDGLWFNDESYVISRKRDL